MKLSNEPRRPILITPKTLPSVDSRPFSYTATAKALTKEKEDPMSFDTLLMNCLLGDSSNTHYGIPQQQHYQHSYHQSSASPVNRVSFAKYIDKQYPFDADVVAGDYIKRDQDRLDIRQHVGCRKQIVVYICNSASLFLYITLCKTFFCPHAVNFFIL
jgi:hypothetical protein